MSSSKFNFSQSDRILKIGGHILFIFIALIIVVSEESPLISPMNILNKYKQTSNLINVATAKPVNAKLVAPAAPAAPVTPVKPVAAKPVEVKGP